MLVRAGGRSGLVTAFPAPTPRRGLWWPGGQLWAPEMGGKRGSTLIKEDTQQGLVNDSSQLAAGLGRGGDRGQDETRH